MKYKYKKRQTFGKRLDVPKDILNKVYNCYLSFSEFIEYGLDDKIPTSCLIEEDRKIVDKFGLEAAKNLDWELLNNWFIHGPKPKELILTISPDEHDLNSVLYEQIKDQIRPIDYSSQMKKIYSNRIFETADIEDVNLKYLLTDFNMGNLSLKEIVKNWNIFKNKDLSICLKNDDNNTKQITENTLREFMEKYEVLAPLILEYKNIYSFINELQSLSTEEEKHEYLKQFTDSILDKTYKKQGIGTPPIDLSEEEYIEIFKYSSLEEYLKIFSTSYTDKIIQELETLPADYIFKSPIPFKQFTNTNVLTFINIYGLQNVVDFDNECGHFFTQDNCKALRSIYPMYIYYGSSKIYTKKDYDENGNYIDRPFTKDEFYEAIRNMILYGPNNGEYMATPLDYRAITGEFRKRNEDLFISEKAPQELQDLYYTKQLTPQILAKHPEYIEYLEDKKLRTCFKSILVRVMSPDYTTDVRNFYEFIEEKMDFKSLMQFITSYVEILDMVLDGSIFSDNLKLGLTTNSDAEDIIKKTNELFRNILIEKKNKYPKTIPERLKKDLPNLFLGDDAPDNLKDALYNRKIDINFIRENPIYTNYLRGLDLELLYDYMPIQRTKDSQLYEMENLVKTIKTVFGTEAFDVMLEYVDLLNNCFQIDKIKGAEVPLDITKGELLDILDDIILKRIIENSLMYSENSPGHFKNNNPTLFLSKDIDENIRNKFYNREFTAEDFSSNPNLFDIFGNTNIACGFPCEYGWIISLFNDKENQKEANKDRLKIITAFGKIEDEILKTIFKENVLDFKDEIDLDKIDYLSEILRRLSLTNSTEMFTFRRALISEILATPNPMDTLNKIEDIFIKNNIPTIGKIYSCFEILHPNFSGFNIEDSKTISPVLKKSSTLNRRIVVFVDLVKCAFGSNNKSINDYLENIEKSTNLYERLISGELNFKDLKEDEIKELTTFLNHLRTLYNNTRKGKNDNTLYTSSGYLLKDIEDLKLKLSPDGTLNYNLADRIIKMFCGFAGINTLDSAREYIKNKIKTADNRNRQVAQQPISLSKGDFIKGIGNIYYLRSILQNGSVAKEFLGSSAGSDNTPLDTDLSMIIDEKDTLDNTIKTTAATSYGPIWFVLKHDDRFMTTRTTEETKDAKIDLSKMETFYTGVLGEGHYGIRTGFASSEINYIIVEEPDPRVSLEIAMNGFYIPVVNKEGKIIFTPEDYDKLRAKMQGLSYFDLDTYNFSNNLVTEETKQFASLIKQNNKDTEEKRDKINKTIRESLESLGLKLKTRIDGDLTEGYVELIDTGSTGRGTNKPGDGDFDFIMRLDNTILSNPTKLQALKQALLQALGKENTSELTGTGDFRLKSVVIDDGLTVDIDITFTKKTDKVSYSTDMAIQDRLTTIKQNDEEKYKYVIANILLAKEVLKSAGAYKPNRGEVPQGGLGGVGIENWILQNGGSFIDAALNFLEASKNKTFEEFIATYQIWDFGENHLSEKRNTYAHDNFVAANMSEEGYKKMTEALKTYIQKYQKSEKLDTKIL